MFHCMQQCIAGFFRLRFLFTLVRRTYSGLSLLLFVANLPQLARWKRSGKGWKRSLLWPCSFLIDAFFGGWAMGPLAWRGTKYPRGMEYPSRSLRASSLQWLAAHPQLRGMCFVPPTSIEYFHPTPPNPSVSISCYGVPI